MRSRGSQPSRSASCPVCDEPLTAAQAGEAAPTCPSCDTHLLGVEAARLGHRIAAALVDLTILLPSAGLLNVGLLYLVGWRPHFSFGLDALLRIVESSATELLLTLSPFLVMSALYFGLFWALIGRTPGGRVMKLRVIDEHGRTPLPLWSAVRAVAMLPGLLVGAIGLLWPAFDLERRAWHDHIARTYVVRSS